MDASESQYNHPAMTATGGAQSAAALKARADGDRATPPDGALFKPFGEDGLTFADFLDIINPLQHIPVVSSIYRHFTGDEIDPAARMAGGTLFGGPIGFIAAMINVGVEQKTGQHVIAALSDDTDDAIDVMPASGPGALADEAGDDLPALTTDDMPWELVTAAGPAVTLAAARTGGAPPPTLAEHPVQQHIAVLEWAQREMAFHQDTERVGRPPAAPLWQAPEEPAAIEGAQRMAPRQGVATETAVNGSVAAQGGWFADTMLDALRKYQLSARLAEQAPGADLNTAN